MGTDDREMVSRYLRGEKEAVETVDGWISRAAWPYKRRLADRWDDVLQDVRLEITRLLGSGKFRGESSLRTYLWRVVSHTCLDQIRVLSKWKLDNLDDIEPIAIDPLIPARQEDKDLLLRVLDRVPQDCRELWRMIMAGLSYREMSLRTQVAEGTLRVRVLRCREKAVAARSDLLGTRSSNGRNITVKRPPNSSGGANANEL
ncbi:MAG TPA: RNA polymerase sigma factor [Thermoanaerobaculia bacterium]|jgi:RNA polymerase sigma factor (sigma-70 family)|nr:RNA polymerase sigma factor [Thermoanaerobaculia bacterium]